MIPSDPRINPLLWTAIEQTRLLRLRYKDKERIVEPHDYGIHNGVKKVLTFQVGGSSDSPLPNWRWMEVESISEMTILDKRFPGGRPESSGKHHIWDELFIRVKARKKDRNS